MHLLGLSLVGGARTAPTARTFHAHVASTGESLAPAYHEATPEQVLRAGDLAADAFPRYARTSSAERAAFLRDIATRIEALGDTLIDRYCAESGLPRARAEGERGRTCLQLRQFADLLSTPAWAEPRIDRAQPERRPQPKPETRSQLRAVGPVAVFGPANFPLAYSVAGGDTASALAAGCPVLVKAHSSHPGTCELVGLAVADAVAAAGLPPGVFALLFGGGRVVGAGLARHPAVRGVGFTGSNAAGRELLTLCSSRPTPIPFFGELSSINPVCLLPGALAARAEAIAEGLAASVTLGCGQFCTNPGLVLHVADSPGLPRFLDTLGGKLRDTPAAAMLNASIRDSYDEGLRRLGETPGVRTLVAPPPGPRTPFARPALFATDSATFRAAAHLHEEVFGPCTLLVACRDVADLTATVLALEGQLTASLHQAGDDLDSASELLFALEQRAGRLIFDGFPTGVEVCPSMVHSGPWPATTDSRFTAVGTPSIRRWLRPVCWQSAPERVLPAEVRG
jgi:acyl-CoA reductase-like NAD-dependent aldehyde dehydrogenase